jgi:hypothetical protein
MAIAGQRCGKRGKRFHGNEYIHNKRTIGSGVSYAVHANASVRGPISNTNGLGTKKNLVMSPKAKYNCAGEGQRQFNAMVCYAMQCRLLVS